MSSIVLDVGGCGKEGSLRCSACAVLHYTPRFAFHLAVEEAASI